MGSDLPSSSAKKWPSEFSKSRKFKDTRPYVEKIKRCIDAAGDDIGILLEDLENRVPSRKTERIKEFCQGARLEDLMSGTCTATLRPAALLDDRIYPIASLREKRTVASATRLLALLKAPQFEEADIPIAHRRSIYIQNLDPYYMVALLEAASFHQISVLRDAIWKHLAFQTALSVRIPTRGYKSFHLEFHLPFFAFRVSPPPSASLLPTVNSRPPRKWTDLSFLEPERVNTEGLLSCGMLEAHSSLVIWGTDNHRWVAYAFSETDFDDETLEDKIFPEDGPQIDPISDTEAEFPIWDAREYFLRAFEVRIANVLGEWEELVGRVKCSIDRYRDRHSCTLSQLSVLHKLRDEDVTRTFDWTRQTMELLSQMLNGLSETIRVWEKFNSLDSDIGYFSEHDLLEEWRGHINNSLYSIQETFEGLRRLQRTLGQLDKFCPDSRQVLQLRLTLESNAATQHTGVTAGLTVLIIAPVGLGMALFSMKDGVVPLQFNLKSFLSVTFCMMIIMKILLFAFGATPNFNWWRGKIYAGMKTLKAEGRVCSLSILNYGINLVSRREITHQNRNEGDLEVGSERL